MHRRLACRKLGARIIRMASYGMVVWGISFRRIQWSRCCRNLSAPSSDVCRSLSQSLGAAEDLSRRFLGVDVNWRGNQAGKKLLKSILSLLSSFQMGSTFHGSWPEGDVWDQSWPINTKGPWGQISSNPQMSLPHSLAIYVHICSCNPVLARSDLPLVS